MHGGMQISYPYVRLRRDFGKHAAFTAPPTQVGAAIFKGKNTFFSITPLSRNGQITVGGVVHCSFVALSRMVERQA